MQMLSIRWVDKTTAIVATLPFVWALYHRWFGTNLSFPRAVLRIQIFILKDQRRHDKQRGSHFSY
jgi:hypothetical protein